MHDIVKHCLCLEIFEMETSPLTQGLISWNPYVVANHQERAEFYRAYSALVEQYFQW